MSQSPAWWRALVLSTIVLCIVFAVSASGQDKKTGSTFATVDFQKIATSYGQREEVEKTIRTMRAKFDARLQRRDNMPLLTEVEQKELDTLTEKDNPSDADKKRIKELTDKGQRLGTEIQALRQKADKDLTDADKQKIKDAEAAFIQAQQQYGNMKEDLTNQLQQYGTTNGDKLVGQIREAVKRVAEQKGVSIVFSSEVALYAGADLTDPVLAELNKKK
jgi:Skp family chaperone for outer membrane proteins